MFLYSGQRHWHSSLQACTNTEGDQVAQQTPLHFVFYFAAPPDKVWEGFVSSESNRIIFAGAELEVDLKPGGSMIWVGTGADGVTAVRNLGSGIAFYDGTTDNVAGQRLVGSDLTGLGNTIANNAGHGVFVDSGTRNAIHQNSLYGNGLLVETQRQMMQSADEVVVVADHTKIGRPALTFLCELNEIDTLIVDPGLSPAQRELLAGSDLRLIVAGEKGEF